MSRKIKIRIAPDGSIKADVVGIKGKQCSKYIPILEEMLGAVAVDSEYTAEAYEQEQVETEVEQNQQQRVRNRCM